MKRYSSHTNIESMVSTLQTPSSSLIPACLERSSRRSCHIATVLDHDPTIHNTLQDPRRLEPGPQKVFAGVGRILVHAKVICAIAGQIIGQRFRHLCERRLASRLEDLDGVRREIHLERKIGPDILRERRGEEGLGASRRIALQHEVVFGAAVAAEQSTGAQHEQVGGEVGALEEHEAVLVRDVEWVVATGAE